MKKLNIVFLILLIVPAAFPEESLAASMEIFGRDPAPPASLESERGWIPVTSLEWDRSETPPLSPGTGRRWRLSSSYEFEGSGGPVTLQVRFRKAGSKPVTFTHPWTDGTGETVKAYSNWLEESMTQLLEGDRGFVEARLIAPPRTPMSGRLYSVVLEAWDEHPEMPIPRSRKPDLQLAYARPLPNFRLEGHLFSPEDESVEDDSTLKAKALEFSLSFVRACLAGDLPVYYRSQSSAVRSLLDGSAVNRYRIPPPEVLNGVQDIESYKQVYDYNLYPYEVYRDLFPQWFSSGRSWTPSEDTFLFMGHQARRESGSRNQVNYLVFLVEQDEDGEWKVVARP